jgi:Mg-chelatase subunit ChlD
VIPTDVVLGIDLSGSMNNDGGTPPQPISDTLVAAKNFIGRLGEKDQSAIVTFATEARTERTLNKNHTDTATLVSSLAIDPIEEVGYTNTPAALTAAANELDSERHNRDARRVLVLLTDGLPTGRGQSEELLEETKNTAKNIAESGVSIYVIGLGSNVDEAFVSALVSDPTHAFYAPTAADLESIYNTISTALCESGATRIDVIAKTPTNFAPLR